MKELELYRKYVDTLHRLVEELTEVATFSATEKQELFWWLANYHKELSQMDHIHAAYPNGMPLEWFSKVVLEAQVWVIRQALHRDLDEEKITASITIEFDIDARTLEKKKVSANWLLSYIKAVDDDTVDGFRINPAVPWCDITSDFFISNPRSVARKVVKNEG